MKIVQRDIYVDMENQEVEEVKLLNLALNPVLEMIYQLQYHNGLKVNLLMFSKNFKDLVSLLKLLKMP